MLKKPASSHRLLPPGNRCKRSLHARSDRRSPSVAQSLPWRNVYMWFLIYMRIQNQLSKMIKQEIVPVPRAFHPGIDRLLRFAVIASRHNLANCQPLKTGLTHTWKRIGTICSHTTIIKLLWARSWLWRRSA
jgi:hypothetical protein